MLCEVDWCSLCSDSKNNVNNIYEKFIENLTEIYDKCFPITKMSRRAFKDKKWFNNELKKTRNLKNSLYKKWIKTKTNSNFLNFKSILQKYKKSIREAKINYYNQLLGQSSTNNYKLMWKNINSLMSTKANKTSANKINKI